MHVAQSYFVSSEVSGGFSSLLIIERRGFSGETVPTPNAAFEHVAQQALNVVEECFRVDGKEGVLRLINNAIHTE